MIAMQKTPQDNRSRAKALAFDSGWAGGKHRPSRHTFNFGGPKAALKRPGGKNGKLSLSALKPRETRVRERAATSVKPGEVPQGLGKFPKAWESSVRLGKVP
jgi:hypothetical protein